MKNIFIDSNVIGESTKKAYVTLFKRIEEHENFINKGIDEWNKKDCLDMLKNCGSKKYNTIAVKWSLLKKYLVYIDNKVYNEISKIDLEKINDETLEYISYSKVIDLISMFENYIDKSLILLLRNGIRGEEFCELTNLKVENIKDNIIELPNRNVILDDYTSNIIHKAIKEHGYRMNVKKNRPTAYSYYSYNMGSEYFWKNRPNKFNDYGLNAMKPNASKPKIGKLIKRMGLENLTSTSLVLSYVIDEILKFEDDMKMILTEVQTDSFIKRLGVKINMYTVYAMKNEIRQERK